GPESLQMLTSHSTGLVIEGMGGGHLPDGVAAVAREAAAHIPIVLASRTGDGYVLEQSYGFSGGEMDLLAAGLISAGDLNGPKARMLLEVALRAASNEPGGYSNRTAARKAFQL